MDILVVTFETLRHCTLKKPIIIGEKVTTFNSSEKFWNFNGKAKIQWMEEWSFSKSSRKISGRMVAYIVCKLFTLNISCFLQ